MTHIRAVIVADGEVDPDALRAQLVVRRGETLLAIGADGGARHLEAAGRLPDLVCGDADSLSQADLQRFRDAGTAVELHPAEKDESDSELAVRAALARGATTIVVCGALGGARIEHGMANQLLLAAPWLDGVNVAVLHGGSWIRRIGALDGPGSLRIQGRATDFVSLLPLDDPVTGIATAGLRYPLRDEPLPLGSTRGLSNELTGDVGTVTTLRGRLLIVHTPSTHVASTDTGGPR